MGAFPFSGRILVRLGQGWVGMDGAQQFVEADALLHGQHKFRQQFTGLGADNGGTENFVLAGHGQHLDEPARHAIGNGAIQVIQAVVGNFARYALFGCLAFVEANPCHLRINKGHRRNHRVIGAEFFELAKQGIDRRIPGLVTGHMGQLVGSCHIARGVDIRVEGLQVFVGHHGAIGCDTLPARSH